MTLQWRHVQLRHYRLRNWLLAGGLALGGLACSEDLDDTDGPPETPMPMPQAGVIDNGDGTWSLVVNATEEPVHVDLADGGLVGAGDGWDLWFQRFHIGVNGGAGGDGQGAAQWAAGADLSVETAPRDGWLQDQPDGDDDDDFVDRVFGDWYDYNPMTHVLTPKAGVYFVRSSDGQAYYAVRIDDYYDDAGTSAMVRITWRTVTGDAIEPEPEAPEPETPEPEMPEPEAPEPEAPEPDVLPADAVEVDATSRDTWAYLRFGETVEAVGEDEGWDLALQRTFIQTNSGTSGDGMAGAKRAEAAYDDISTAPTIGYAADALVPLPGPPGSGEASGSPIFNDTMNGWYNYNPATHQVSAKDQAYVVRTHDGQYARFAIAQYAGGVFQVRGSLVDAAPETASLSVNAPNTWGYVNLRDGASVEIADPATSLDWDLGVYGVRVRTNSGTSGSGAGGAYEAMDPADGVAEDCVADAMVPQPGPPGSGEFSGSPTLSAWYDYDFMTHTVAPKDTDWVVCTADGGVARLRVTAYGDDTLDFEWRYAGPGRSAF